MANYKFLKNIVNPDIENILAREAEQAASQEGSVGASTMADALKKAGVVDEAGRINPDVAESSSVNPNFILGEAGPISRPPVPFKSVPAEIPETISIDPAALEKYSGGSFGNAPPTSRFYKEPGKSPNDIIDVEALKDKGYSDNVIDWLKNNKIKASLGAGAAGIGAYEAMSPNSPKAINSAPPSAPSAPKLALLPPPASEDTPIEKESATDRAMKNMMALYKKPSADELEAGRQKQGSKVIDFGQGATSSSADYQKMLDDMKQKEFIVNLGRAMAQMAAASGGNKNYFDSSFEGMLKQVGQAPAQFEAANQFKKQDPNSPISQGYRQLANAMGFDIRGNASAADLEKLYPQLSNIYTQQAAQANRAGIAKDNREARMAELQLRLAMGQDAKNEMALEKDRQKLGDLTNFSKQARGNAAQIENLVNQGERLQTLVDILPKNAKGEPDLNRVTPTQKQELLKTLDTLLAGKSTVSGQQELMKSANSIYNEAAVIKQYITGNKAYGNESGLLKSIVDTITREKGLAYEKIKDMAYQNSIGFQRLEQKDPAYIRRILKEKAMMDDSDIELRKAGYRGNDLNRLLNQGYSKDELVQAARAGKKASELEAKGNKIKAPQAPQAPKPQSLKPADVDKLSDEEVEKELQSRGL